MVVFRLALYSLCILVLLGLLATVYIIAEAFDPAPGANMVLMALPVIALPTGTIAGVLVLGVLLAWQKLRLYERWALLATGLLAWISFGVLWLLG